MSKIHDADLFVLLPGGSGGGEHGQGRELHRLAAHRGGQPVGGAGGERAVQSALHRRAQLLLQDAGVGGGGLPTEEREGESRSRPPDISDHARKTARAEFIPPHLSRRPRLWISAGQYIVYFRQQERREHPLSALGDDIERSKKH